MTTTSPNKTGCTESRDRVPPSQVRVHFICVHLRPSVVLVPFDSSVLTANGRSFRLSNFPLDLGRALRTDAQTFIAAACSSGAQLQAVRSSPQLIARQSCQR